MADHKLPDLTFQSLKHSKREVPLDLRWLLYRGGAQENVRDVDERINSGSLGNPIRERVPLVQKIHEHLAAKLAGGGSSRSLITNSYALRYFFRYLDDTGHPLKLANFQLLYVEWVDTWIHRVRVKKDISERSAYDIVAKVGAIVDAVLERSRPIIAQVRLRGGQRSIAVSSKQNLPATFQFGHTLHDICSALTVAAIRGPLPIRIRFRSGQQLERWCRLGGTQASTDKSVWDAHNLNASLENRSRVVNLRLEAEILIFIAQTGMNWEQAVAVTTGDFGFTSHNDGYRVSRRKNRRNGDVEFQIYKQYREHFEAYLLWRRAIFTDQSDTRLFPFIAPWALEREKRAIKQIRPICEELGIQSFGPQALRKTRVNFLLRQSNDLELTSDMAQNSKQTLLRYYVQPNHQIAIVEIHRFHQKNDSIFLPPGPGSCTSGVAEPLSGIPEGAPQPDCANPAGCLFCSMQRDVDSQDYVWSLASFRYLKSLELSMCKSISTQRQQPSELAIVRITQKLNFFEKSSVVRCGWVKESLERLFEGHYHPMWSGFIEMREQGL